MATDIPHSLSLVPADTTLPGEPGRLLEID